MRRVANVERKKLYKNINSNRAKELSLTREVFTSGHEKEITIDNTFIEPQDVANIIIRQLIS